MKVKYEQRQNSMFRSALGATHKEQSVTRDSVYEGIKVDSLSLGHAQLGIKTRNQSVKGSVKTKNNNKTKKVT